MSNINTRPRRMIVNSIQIFGTELPDNPIPPGLSGYTGLFCLKDRPGFSNIGFKGLFLLLLAFQACSGPQNRIPGPPVSISMKALTGLQYDVVRFLVKPGSKVKITLANVSDMSHNFLITKPGTRMDVVNAALSLAEKGPQMDYIPAIDAVLWSIPVMSPGQTKSVEFTAPMKSGIYPYVCTYPGHGFVMFGAMYVSTDEGLPDISNDLNIPESRRQDVTAGVKEGAEVKKPVAESPHPYPLVAPYLYHVFIEGASPAAFAVHLPQELSYCWDAGDCRLSFAWKGGFLDMSDLWKGHFNASAKIPGDIFFRDNTEYPIRLGKNATVPTVEYKGYRLINRYPEFHYRLNGLDVYEMIRQKEDGFGLVRVFRIPNADREVWFFTNRQEDAIEYKFSAGRYKDKKLELSTAEAKAFTITMTSYYLAYKNNE
ncbi:MAG: plastocyanin/azurin family copper-binding protein [Ferruginibacter sp.]